MESRTPQMNRAPVYRIAGLTAAISGADFLKQAGRDYLTGDVSRPDIAFDAAGPARLLQEKNPQADWATCCYVASARQFYVHLLPFEGFVLHACALVLDGGAYLFSADSGTGKSTHASLWLSRFGAARAYILNDDKPLIRRRQGQYLAYGAPWCGSAGIQKNRSAPIKGVAFLTRGGSDWIRSLAPREALSRLLCQSDPQVRFERMGTLLPMLGDFLANVPMYLMGCTISENAVRTAYGAMAGDGRAHGCIQMA